MLAPTFLPFLVIAAAGGIAIGFQSPMAWGRMIFGTNWMTSSLASRCLHLCPSSHWFCSCGSKGLYHNKYYKLPGIDNLICFSSGR